MKKIFLLLILNIALYADLSDIGKNFNKALELEGKLLDRANEILDGKQPLFQVPKIQYNRKPQDIMCQSNLQMARSTNTNLKKHLQRKNKEVDRLRKENLKFKKILEMHGIDYRHAEIRVELKPKPKKMKMIITDR